MKKILKFIPTETPYRSVQYLFNPNNQDVISVDIIKILFANGIGIESSKR